MNTASWVLIVDDDSLFRDSLAAFLERDGMQVEKAADLASARRKVDGRIGVVILDQRLPDGDGLSLIQELRNAGLPARVLMVTAHPDLSNAVDGLRLRIDDYMSKPIEPEVIRHAVLRSFETLRLERLEQLTERNSEGKRQTTHLIGPSLEEVRRLVSVAGTSPSPVMISGETGTGKGLVASAIHFASPGRSRPWVKINCAAIPPTLVEAELFGVEKGAFTGAGSARPGLFELADGGTLFLDEVGELDSTVQSKLLAVLEDGSARRVGGSRLRYFTVRVIAATNLNLATAVEAGRFRQDLLYRLDVLRIDIPPLRERLGDLPELVQALLLNLPGGRGAQLQEGELERLAHLSWPGNVRELRNLLERSLLLHPATSLRPSALTNDSSAKPLAKGTTPSPSTETLEEVERHHILSSLAANGGNKSLTARQLGIGIATLRRKLIRYRSN
ncbi:MAG: sigma-54 dependent transcriptional regulator [Deltaproteobacteria bacterium]|nr:sigma-54 dependent transcriptional regulator [Deltaproteobacteria bacterium]